MKRNENEEVAAMVIRFVVLFTVVHVLGPSLHVKAHPWGGLEIDSLGNVYFVSVNPVAGEGHYACIWVVSPSGVAKPGITSAHSPSDMVVMRSHSRQIFGVERFGQEPNHKSAIWQYDSEAWTRMLRVDSSPAVIPVQAVLTDGASTVYFASGNRLFTRAIYTGQDSLVVELADNERIQDLAWGSGDSIFVLGKDNLWVVHPGDPLGLVASGLREDDPEYLPFTGANILFDLAVDDDGYAYVAYFGNRQVIKVSPTGQRSVVLQAEEPWSAHGIDIFEEDVYVLESSIGESTLNSRVRKIKPTGEIELLFSNVSSEPIKETTPDFIPAILALVLAPVFFAMIVVLYKRYKASHPGES